jgi:hypothetical protein
MASLHSSLNHGFPGCFGFVEVFGIVSSAIDITVSLNFKIGSKQNNHRQRKKLEDFLSQEGLCIFSDGTDTYLHPGNGSYSAMG